MPLKPLKERIEDPRREIGELPINDTGEYLTDFLDQEEGERAKKLQEEGYEGVHDFLAKEQEDYFSTQLKRDRGQEQEKRKLTQDPSHLTDRGSPKTVSYVLEALSRLGAGVSGDTYDDKNHIAFGRFLNTPHKGEAEKIRQALLKSNLYRNNPEDTLKNFYEIARIIKEQGKGWEERDIPYAIDFQMNGQTVQDFPWASAMARGSVGIEAALRNWGAIPDKAQGAEAVPYLRQAMKGLYVKLREMNLPGNAEKMRRLITKQVQLYLNQRKKQEEARKDRVKGVDKVRQRFGDLFTDVQRGSQAEQMLEGYLKSRRLVDQGGYVVSQNRLENQYDRIYNYLTRTLGLKHKQPARQKPPKSQTQVPATKPNIPPQRDTSHLHQQTNPAGEKSPGSLSLDNPLPQPSMPTQREYQKRDYLGRPLK